MWKRCENLRNRLMLEMKKKLRKLRVLGNHAPSWKFQWVNQTKKIHYLSSFLHNLYVIYNFSPETDILTEVQQTKGKPFFYIYTLPFPLPFDLKKFQNWFLHWQWYPGVITINQSDEEVKKKKKERSVWDTNMLSFCSYPSDKKSPFVRK